MLVGLFRDEKSLVPIQMEIKHTTNEENRLYMTVAMTKIEADVLGTAVGIDRAPSLISAPTYRLADIFREINPADAHFLKYLPGGFLSEGQKAAKQDELWERLNSCNPKVRETALQLLSVYLKSVE